MAVPTFTKTGTKATTAAKLDKSVFGVEVANHELLKPAVKSVVVAVSLGSKKVLAVHVSVHHVTQYGVAVV
jgi:hypothetical protein